ncbi:MULTISPECIES: CDP-alcohol phosphatidyltransferase family protein [Azorhizobium]|uniref:CDP-diacylglycerol--glycerol-3-phosphate 3-phosphatidyltransferase n=1 Tax=Azorhizobium caulinodans (strain ATCC 43989 / DSM 5975 / JCM 20966 / LMG 6465 / NBRC 14845 / NCIMB 13405 / ORS 571) TaxID=438753 RepID=A8HUE7_AZOC5|nr:MULTISPECIES: CDP-alcohol phosphatidyltransferase family protein [Azorhizobium]TDT92863.1 cardiolipin synthase [Azorhizobium sp. AG788]BAF86935.1 CDP-alcohol phosphatidyltransferase [Azorhizobium caulinodans ORS 571]
MNLPNLITIGRLIIVPVVIWAISADLPQLALGLFLLAGLSDAVDGFIARRFNMRTELGAYLDPLADKALLVSIYVTLAISGDIPRWVAIAVVSRDLMIVGAIVLSSVLAKPVVIRPLAVSKVNTAVQIAFAALVLSRESFDFAWTRPYQLGLVAVGGLTALSAAAYLAAWMRHMAR